jgi:serine/threonine protein kinase
MPFLTDFGSARWMNVKDDVGGMQMVMPGTQTYMSYEQLQGDVFRLDQRTDIFSLAVLACYAFTGINPFQARSDIDIHNEPMGLASLSMVDPEVPKIPYRSGDKLREFLLECLSRDPEQRPNSMVAFQHRLNSWILES